MAAQVLPMFDSEALSPEQEDWKARFPAFVSLHLEELLNH